MNSGVQAADTDIEVTVRGSVPRDQVDAVRGRVASLQLYADRPLIGARVVVREDEGLHSGRPFVADASVLYQGRLLAAHTTGGNALEAVDAAAERLRRQLRRVVGADVAQRNEPRTIRRAISELENEVRHRPRKSRRRADEREIVRRRTYEDLPRTTAEAVTDLLDLDLEFLLFRHVRTGEDVVVYRRDDGRIGLIHPPDSPLADENDVVVPEPSDYPSPLTLQAARAEMDRFGQRFAYFIDAEDVRGKVLYLRHDGHYGLVEPA